MDLQDPKAGVLYEPYLSRQNSRELYLGGCPRTATVARASLIESYFLVI